MPNMKGQGAGTKQHSIQKGEGTTTSLSRLSLNGTKPQKAFKPGNSAPGKHKRGQQGNG